MQSSPEMLLQMICSVQEEDERLSRKISQIRAELQSLDERIEEGEVRCVATERQLEALNKEVVKAEEEYEAERAEYLGACLVYEEEQRKLQANEEALLQEYRNAIAFLPSSACLSLTPPFSFFPHSDHVSTHAFPSETLFSSFLSKEVGGDTEIREETFQGLTVEQSETRRLQRADLVFEYGSDASEGHQRRVEEEDATPGAMAMKNGAPSQEHPLSSSLRLQPPSRPHASWHSRLTVDAAIAMVKRIKRETIEKETKDLSKKLDSNKVVSGNSQKSSANEEQEAADDGEATTIHNFCAFTPPGSSSKMAAPSEYGKGEGTMEEKEDTHARCTEPHCFCCPRAALAWQQPTVTAVGSSGFSGARGEVSKEGAKKVGNGASIAAPKEEGSASCSNGAPFSLSPNRLAMTQPDGEKEDEAAASTTTTIEEEAAGATMEEKGYAAAKDGIPHGTPSASLGTTQEAMLPLSHDTSYRFPVVFRGSSTFPKQRTIMRKSVHEAEHKRDGDQEVGSCSTEGSTPHTAPSSALVPPPFHDGDEENENDAPCTAEDDTLSIPLIEDAWLTALPTSSDFPWESKTAKKEVHREEAGWKASHGKAYAALVSRLPPPLPLSPLTFSVSDNRHKPVRTSKRECQTATAGVAVPVVSHGGKTISFAPSPELEVIHGVSGKNRNRIADYPIPLPSSSSTSSSSPSSSRELLSSSLSTSEDHIVATENSILPTPSLRTLPFPCALPPGSGPSRHGNKRTIIRLRVASSGSTPLVSSAPLSSKEDTTASGEVSRQKVLPSATSLMISTTTTTTGEDPYPSHSQRGCCVDPVLPLPAATSSTNPSSIPLRSSPTSTVLFTPSSLSTSSWAEMFSPQGNTLSSAITHAPPQDRNTKTSKDKCNRNSSHIHSKKKYFSGMQLLEDVNMDYLTSIKGTTGTLTSSPFEGDPPPPPSSLDSFSRGGVRHPANTADEGERGKRGVVQQSRNDALSCPRVCSALRDVGRLPTAAEVPPPPLVASPSLVVPTTPISSCAIGREERSHVPRGASASWEWERSTTEGKEAGTPMQEGGPSPTVIVTNVGISGSLAQKNAGRAPPLSHISPITAALYGRLFSARKKV